MGKKREREKNQTKGGNGDVESAGYRGLCPLFFSYNPF
jgi:hypothetical protein